MSIKIKLLSYLLFLTFFPVLVSAQMLDTKTNLGIHSQADAFSESAGFDLDTRSDTLSETIAMLIKVFLGFLGIIFIVLIVWAGYNWMTAGGNEEKVSKAKTTITRAIIGLIITISAYAITYFVFNALGPSA